MSGTLVARLRHWWNKPNQVNQRRRGVLLDLETLETRTVPSNLPAGLAPPPDNQVFLATVYQGELRRPIDDAGLLFWENQLNQNLGRAQVVGAILNSNEYFSRLVSTDFSALLGRAPDAAGLAYWVSEMDQGATPQAVKANILGSDEFFARFGGESQSFLNALYAEELGRAVDSVGQQTWTPWTGDAGGRTLIAQAVEASPEATQLVVATIYQDTLGHIPDAAGSTYWASPLQQGQSQSTVLAGILGSDEFFGRLQTYTAQLDTADPNVAAAEFINAAQLFKSRPAVVPEAPPTPAFTPMGGNSGFDTPAGDNTGGDVLGGNNSIGTIVIPDTTVVNTSVPDNSVPIINNSTPDLADNCQPSDCGCLTLDTSAGTGDNGTPDMLGSTSE
jgi:hypothetical protein